MSGIPVVCVKGFLQCPFGDAKRFLHFSDRFPAIDKTVLDPLRVIERFRIENKIRRVICLALDHPGEFAVVNIFSNEAFTFLVDDDALDQFFRRINGRGSDSTVHVAGCRAYGLTLQDACTVIRRDAQRLAVFREQRQVLAYHLAV
ncbi:hypothetical protein D3C78_997560 [compost metagenome]